ncbi:hypothetical protein Cal7507_4038 [Calothrix sp. PCC 7507]|nr:hypothetical protein Cal7507_4038 [Calothrix sp. PCC 7507]
MPLHSLKMVKTNETQHYRGLYLLQNPLDGDRVDVIPQSTKSHLSKNF